MLRIVFYIFCLTLSSIIWPSPNSMAQEDSIAVFPASIHLTGHGAMANVIVQQKLSSTVGRQITGNIKLHISDPGIARIEQGSIVAESNGTTELLVHVAGHSKPIRVPIEVVHANQERQWQFNADVQSVFSRQGCNSGACHGALAGKGGFRLSLHAYNDLADHFALTRQDRGRRIEPADPGRSLILAKPSGLIPHKGGLRLEEDSSNYRVLAQWIANGAPGPKPQDAPLQRIEVLPESMQLALNNTQQIIVRAHYEDGRVEDVTRWAKFSATQKVVAEVNEDGQIRVVGSGKGAVVVWFASRIAISSIIVPYENRIDEVAFRDFNPNNLVDEILLDEWRSLNLAPSPGCSDETFLRRIYLDMTGTLPDPADVRAFLGNTSATRRQQVVEELLGGKSYVDYWSYKWSDLLLVNGNLLRPDAVAAFYKWIRGKVEANAPWDEFAREIVLARGESMEQGATNFYAIHQDPESLTENTCQAFMGLSIGCAKCHNHPLEKWTNDQYYSMANLFARVRAKGWGGDARNGDGKRTLVVLDRGDLIQPSIGQPQLPAPLDAPPIDIDDTGDRRVVLADWLTHPDNRYFCRSIANRVWANFMGVGLVESVDDLRASNPASSEVLLNALADYLIEQEYDLKALARLIVSSSAYQRTSEVIPANASDQRFYCRYYPRRLKAEVLHDAIVTVTKVPTKFTEIEFAGADKKPTEFYPEGTRSLELYDSAVSNYFLKTFGRHQRRITCNCERSDQPTVIQALHLNNGDTINEKLAAPECIVAKWTDNEVAAPEAITDAYLTTLSRFPSADERRRILTMITQADAAGVERSETYQDLLWSLMTSREFLFSH